MSKVSDTHFTDAIEHCAKIEKERKDLYIFAHSTEHFTADDLRKRTDLELCIEDIQDFNIAELNELSAEIARRQQNIVDSGLLAHGEADDRAKELGPQPINVSNDLIYVSKDGVKIIPAKTMQEIGREMVELTTEYCNQERIAEIK